MTTPMSVYKDLAIQYGNINTEDSDAVNRFFEQDVYSLPLEKRLEIIDILFKRVKDEESIQEAPVIIDEHVPFPNPDNYERADSIAPKPVFSENEFVSVEQFDIAFHIAKDFSRSDSKYVHAISRTLAKLTRGIFNIESKWLGHEQVITKHSDKK